MLELAGRLHEQPVPPVSLDDPQPVNRTSSTISASSSLISLRQSVAAKLTDSSHDFGHVRRRVGLLSNERFSTRIGYPISTRIGHPRSRKPSTHATSPAFRPASSHLDSTLGSRDVLNSIDSNGVMVESSLDRARRRGCTSHLRFHCRSIGSRVSIDRMSAAASWWRFSPTVEPTPNRLDGPPPRQTGLMRVRHRQHRLRC